MTERDDPHQSQQQDLAKILTEISDGKIEAATSLMPMVYDRMRLLARKMLRSESVSHTLQPTALVNEVYLRMIGPSQVDWQGKTHFLAVGAKVMRRVLLDHARSRKRLKRGGEMHRIELADDLCVSNRCDEDVLALEEALIKLAKLDVRQEQVVELRFYGGLTVEEVAEVLGLSKRTVESDWTFARAWLRRELSGAPSA